MLYNRRIAWAGNPSEARQSETPEPIVERASSKLQIPAVSGLYAATKPKARSTMGFVLSGPLTRTPHVVGACMGCLEENTERRDSLTGLPWGCNSHTEAAGFNSGGWGRLKAARPDTAQVNLPLFTLFCNGVGGGFAVNL